MTRLMRRLAAAAALALSGTAAQAQTPGADPNSAAPFGPPVEEMAFSHLIVDQLEARLAKGQDAGRWSAEAWTGDDHRRLWLRSEGTARDGQVEEGRHELLLGVPATSFWDVQGGVRADLDSGPARGWVAVGVEGLAPYFLHVAATTYAGDRGRLALRFEAADDLRLTQRLILEPRVEANLYAKDDRARRVGSGLSSFEAGLRLRYEVTRKFAPYLGVNWERRFGHAGDFARADGESAHTTAFVVGVRGWF